MSSAVIHNLQPAYTSEPLYRLTVDQYHDLINSGKLTSDDPVELLEGILVFKMPKKPIHSGTVQRARKAIEPLIPTGWRYRAQEPVTLDDGEPEPDGAIARGSDSDDFVSHPTANETTLVIEVADATLTRDRGIKLRSYARASIATYWIINLIDRKIETYTEPDLSASPESTYLHQEIYMGDAAVPLIIAGQQVGTIPASALLPPSSH